MISEWWRYYFIDCGVEQNGYYGDSIHMKGEVSNTIKDLLTRTKESLYKGIEQQFQVTDLEIDCYTKLCRRIGYGVVREMVGHGIGKFLHEEPQVPNYGRKKWYNVKEGLLLLLNLWLI